MRIDERVAQLYEAERERIYSYLLYLGLPAAEAQELTQDAFLRLHVEMRKPAVVENPRAWLYRVAHNLAARAHSRALRFDETVPHLQFAAAGPDPEQQVLAQSRRATLARAIRALSPQQRNCLHLRAEGLRYREIAATLGISTSAVGEFLRRAAVHLKEAFDE